MMWVIDECTEEGRCGEMEATEDTAREIRPEGGMIPWWLGLHDLVAHAVAGS